MATDERLSDLLRELDRPIAPEAAFAGQLYERLRIEAGFDRAARPGARRWLWGLLTGLAPRPLILTQRPVLLALLALLLAAGVAAAAYIALQGWLSTGPRGIQFSDEFTFSEVYREGGEPLELGLEPLSLFYPEFAMARDGSVLYAVRRPTYPEPAASLVRFTNLDGRGLAREEVLAYSTLTDPALWDPSLDPSTFDIGDPFRDGGDTLAIGPNGELFLAIAAYGRELVPNPGAEEQAAELRAMDPDISDEEIARLTSQQPLLGVSLIALAPDGGRQRVVTSHDLEAAGLDIAGRGFSISVATSAPDRLWLKVAVHGPGLSEPHLFQVVDPTGDGDWSDRLVLPLALPPTVPASEGVPVPGDAATGPVWFYRGPTAEISTAQTDRSRSVLLPMLASTGEYRIYRISDPNRDGDAADEGEATLVFTAQPGFGDAPMPSVTSRVVVDGGREVVRELLVSSLTRPTRISRVLEDGTVIDIARAIDFGPLDVEAAPGGDVFAVVQEPGSGERGSTYVVYRLEPVPAGETAAASTSPSASATLAAQSPSASPAASATITPGVPRIAYTLEIFSETEESARILVVGADGSGPTELIPGEHNSYFCQSADGSLIGFWSDEEVPHESFVYVANADGTGRRQISEEVGVFWCGFSSRYMLIAGRAESGPILRYDLESGDQTELLAGADRNRLQADPDGRRYLFVSGLRPATNPPTGAETLELIDVESGERQALHGPLPEDRMFGALTWSADGELVAYAIGPRPSPDDFEPVGAAEVYVQKATGAAPRLVHRFEGRLPHLAVSGDARHMLVSTASAEAPGALSLVDLGTGEARAIAADATWAGWHPSHPTSFAYATKEVLFLASVDGTSEELARVPAEGICPDCETSGAPAGEWGWGNWMGWSPDGRYIGLPGFAPVIAVIDVETGELAILTGDVGEGALVTGGRWLR
jgi:Tol biopolymer transport system component